MAEFTIPIGVGNSFPRIPLFLNGLSSYSGEEDGSTVVMSPITNYLKTHNIQVFI